MRFEVVSVAAILLSGVSLAFAQSDEPRGGAQAMHEKTVTSEQMKTYKPLRAPLYMTLRGEPKARYLLRQAELSSASAAKMEPLVTEFAAKCAPEIFDQMNRLYRKRDEAIEKQQLKEVPLINEKLKQLERDDPSRAAEGELWEKASQLLAPEENHRLTQARERLLRNPSGIVRPADIIQIVLEMDSLTPEQELKFAEALKAVRKAVRPQFMFDEAERHLVSVRLVTEIKALLTPAQCEALDRGIEQLKPPPVQ